MKTQHPSAAARKKIFIVDDHPLLREGLTKVINQQDDLVVCGEADSAPHGLAAVARVHPDAAVVDISLEEGSGLDLIKALHAQRPKLPILALSVHHEDLYAERAIHAGAKGYVMKREPVGVVLAALRKVLGGHLAVSDSIVSRLVDSTRRDRTGARQLPVDALSDRELEVFRLLGEGCCTCAIADKLHIAASTVETYRASLKQKLGLGNATELVARAAQFVATEAGR